MTGLFRSVFRLHSTDAKKHIKDALASAKTNKDRNIIKKNADAVRADDRKDYVDAMLMTGGVVASSYGLKKVSGIGLSSFFTSRLLARELCIDGTPVSSAPGSIYILVEKCTKQPKKTSFVIGDALFVLGEKIDDIEFSQFHLPKCTRESLEETATMLDFDIDVEFVWDSLDEYITATGGDGYLDSDSAVDVIFSDEFCFFALPDDDQQYARKLTTPKGFVPSMKKAFIQAQRGELGYGHKYCSKERKWIPEAEGDEDDWSEHGWYVDNSSPSGFRCSSCGTFVRG